MRLMRVGALLLVLALVTAACGGQAMDEPAATEGALTVDNVSANLTLPSDTGAVYMQITNGTEVDDALIDATVPGCGTIELHEMVMDGDVMRMRQMEGNRIPVPAGETVMLQRGGLHVMCIDKTGEFAVGDEVPVTLQFENAGTIEVMAMVIEPGEMPEGMEMEMEGGMGDGE